MGLASWTSCLCYLCFLFRARSLRRRKSLEGSLRRNGVPRTAPRPFPEHLPPSCLQSLRGARRGPAVLSKAPRECRCVRKGRAWSKGGLSLSLGRSKIPRARPGEECACPGGRGCFCGREKGAGNFRSKSVYSRTFLAALGFGDRTGISAL